MKERKVLFLSVAAAVFLGVLIGFVLGTSRLGMVTLPSPTLTNTVTLTITNLVTETNLFTLTNAVTLTTTNAVTQTNTVAVTNLVTITNTNIVAQTNLVTITNAPAPVTASTSAVKTPNLTALFTRLLSGRKVSACSQLVSLSNPDCSTVPLPIGPSNTNSQSTKQKP